MTHISVRKFIPSRSKGITVMLLNLCFTSVNILRRFSTSLLFRVLTHEDRESSCFALHEKKKTILRRFSKD
jgi:hypothetical protein